jgi:hypothetical protein
LRGSSPFGSAAPNWGTDYTDLWWNASESGWGLTLAQHGDNIFGVWFTYDAAGKPLWIVLPGVNFTSNNSFSGTLYTTTGPPLDNVPFDPSHVVVTPVGSAFIAFNGHSGTFTSTVHGYTQSKAITSEQFGDSPPPQGVSVNALIPPGALSGLDASAIQQYVLNNPTVNGGTFQVEWSAIDQGPAAGSNQYNWTYTDSLYAAWSNAGKQVNFVFWPNADSSSNNCGAEGQYGDGTAGNCAIPAYV